jgi:hypothetical protein
MRVVMNLGVPTERSRDILQQAKGISFIESAQIRWFSRLSGGGGWSGRAEDQQRPRVSKLKAKGLSDYHFNKTVVEAARWRAIGPNKRATFTTCLLKKGELKAALCLTEKGKSQPARENRHHG